MRKLLFGFLFLVGLPALSGAQPVTQIRVDLFRQTTSGPVAVATPLTTAVTDWTCGFATSPNTAVVNPTTLEVENPDPTLTDACRLSNPAVAAFIAQLGYDPVNTYIARAYFINIVGTGPVSADSNPFSRPGTAPTVAPAFLRWGRGQ